MNSIEILNAIEEVAATPSKLEKEALVKKYVAHDEFKRVLAAALNPLISYGIKAIPARELGAAGFGMFDETTWNVIEKLRTRTITGAAMQDTVWFEINNRLDQESAELFKRILIKDLRAGFGGNTANKACSGLIPDTPYMRCSLPKEAKLESFDWARGVFSQEKADGMFTNVNHEEGGLVELFARSGHSIPADGFQNIVREVQANFATGTQTHGELLVVRAGEVLARQIGNGILNHVIDGGEFGPGEFPILKVWDQVPLETVAKPKGKCATAYMIRLARLKDQTKTCQYAKLIDTRIVHSLQEAYVHYRELLALGKEGTIVKDPHMPWSDNTSKWQVKLKLEFVVDLEIVSLLPGDPNGKYASTFGSLLVKTSDGLLEVGVSGFKAAIHKMLWEKRESLPGMIVAVKANDIMPPSKSNKLHSLFLPGYVELRRDKFEADSLQRVIDQRQAAIEGKELSEELKEAA